MKECLLDLEEAIVEREQDRLYTCQEWIDFTSDQLNTNYPLRANLKKT